MALERAAKGLKPTHQPSFEARGLLVTALIALKQLEEADSLAQQQCNRLGPCPSLPPTAFHSKGRPMLDTWYSERFERLIEILGLNFGQA